MVDHGERFPEEVFELFDVPKEGIQKSFQ